MQVCYESRSQSSFQSNFTQRQEIVHNVASFAYVLKLTELKIYFPRIPRFLPFGF